MLEQRRPHGPRIHYMIRGLAKDHDGHVHATLMQVTPGFPERTLVVPVEHYGSFVALIERQTRSRFIKRASDYRWFLESLEVFIRRYQVDTNQTHGG